MDSVCLKKLFIPLFEVEKVVAETQIGKECWRACGQKTGHCPQFCGFEGYCCKTGFSGCPSNISTSLISTTNHACVTPSPKGFFTSFPPHVTRTTRNKISLLPLLTALAPRSVDEIIV